MNRAPTNRYAVLVASASLLLAGCLDRELKELNPCLVSVVTETVQVKNIEQVDLLFMVDNSNSMRDEQAALRKQFGPLIRVLTTGDRDGDGKQDFPPAKDLHLGVVSSDMGLINVAEGAVDNCMGFGGDGILLNTPSKDVPNCRPDIPKFIAFESGKDDPLRTADDFACIATLGTGGCGIEQQLEAPLKALWPKIDPMPENGKNRIEFAGDFSGLGRDGHGDGANAGFLRGGATGESLLAIILVTDEEDCSTADTRTFDPYLDASNPISRQPLNLRCFHNPDKLYPLTRYINGFQALRKDKGMVIFGAIVGVPQDLVKPEVIMGVDWEQPAQVDAYYKRILDDPRMQEVVDPSSLQDTPSLVPSCHNGESHAAPPRRIVEVARGFGRNGTVHSICENDFGPAMDRIIALIGERLGAVCLPRPLVRDKDGVVGCNVVWEMPLPSEVPPGVPTTCDALPFLRVPENRDTHAAGGRAVCQVAQLAVVPDATAVGGLKAVPTAHDGVMFENGWFYDDFSPERMMSCKHARAAGGTLQRVSFSPGAAPPTGVSVKLECLNEAQSLAQHRSDLSPNFKQPKIGDPCNQVREGEPRSDADACIVNLAQPTAQFPTGIDNTMFCHPEQNVCVLSCQTSADCPAAWVCDDRPETLAETADPGVRANGSAICVNPTCGGSND